MHGSYTYYTYIHVYSWPVIILLFGFQARPRHWSRFDLAFMSLSGAMHAWYLAARYVIFVYYARVCCWACSIRANKCVEQESPGCWPLGLLLYIFTTLILHIETIYIYIEDLPAISVLLYWSTLIKCKNMRTQILSCFVTPFVTK